jgi:hypothetical protein
LRVSVVNASTASAWGSSEDDADGAPRSEKRSPAVACAGQVIRQDEDPGGGGAIQVGLELRIKHAWLQYIQ